AEALYTLQQGEVLSFQADGSVLALRDLSGSRVSATQKVAVFSGHEEAVVQPPSCDDGCCAEHIEEQLLPLAVWGAVVPCAKAPPRGPSDMDLWRIQAGAAGVVLTTSPPIPGLHGQVLAEDGDWVQAFAGASFLVEATGPIQVAQYLASQGCTEDFIGDPALVMAVPAARYRSSYVFATLEGYAENLVTIVRPVGAAVALDGAPLAGGAFQAVGSSGWEVGYFEVEGGAAHTVVGASPFGLYLYGYSGPVSYGCPGGLDLVPDP
ncbi:MAG: IgGFc-binding protein, partial [Pseudomonadota bacterium]